MHRRLRQIAPRPSPALVVAALALTVAVASTALAVVPLPSAKVSGAKIAKRSEPGNRFVPDSVTGKQVNESKLKILPSALAATSATHATHAASASTATTAGTASTLGGITPAGLVTKCPSGTVYVGGACIEDALRPGPPLAYIAAAQACGDRRLPTMAQLIAISNGGVQELSAELFSGGGTPTAFTWNSSGVTIGVSSAALPYRCVTDPSN